MNMEKTFSRRINIVSIKMVKEGSVTYKDRRISTPSQAYQICREFLEFEGREKLIVMSLDTENQPTSINVASIGTLNSSLVHPREVFKTAILGNASSVIIEHNHPSGDTTPSSEDINITNRLIEGGKILGIDIIDHLIIGEDGRYESLKDKGFIK